MALTCDGYIYYSAPENQLLGDYSYLLVVLAEWCGAPLMPTMTQSPIWQGTSGFRELKIQTIARTRRTMATATPKRSPIFEALAAKLSSGPAQKLEDAFYNPRPQSYWYHDGTTWVEATSSPPPTITSSFNPTKIRLISWNIDILVPFSVERMSAALNYLSSLVSQTPASTPIVIYLQEMGQSDLSQIRDTRWVQEKFYITEYDERNWLSPLCGTTMLVDRRLRVQNVFRVPWISKFERDGLFVDIGLIPLSPSGSPSASAGEETPKPNALRLCNCHLESLIADPPIRPLQLSAAATYLREDGISAALLAGDLNAIQPFDHTLHSSNGLKDAYLELGGVEDSDDGYTWGYQIPEYLKGKFGCSRMDKILFRGEVKAETFERIGMGVMVAEEKREEVREAGELEWVTDHYGVMGDFSLEEWRLLGVGAGRNFRETDMLRPVILARH
ncbi:uncharacterized protein BDR25DRAFT_391542 [Lindgomyces ingoldianus]|uniref:Uncharacterized protein n=1 Tax=Lindgomyces ingoldianus TaxID=673940 RepID=A0ACB6R842_9PLEO|nr:uncharacterized protein BDR25DRAFT_391542 [Lindgomyces ingoldianus]KAF2475419.1 hypothetical protein BDR25DRAFT_391542 [Lindgomyces ingoldianus]